MTTLRRRRLIDFAVSFPIYLALLTMVGNDEWWWRMPLASVLLVALSLWNYFDGSTRRDHLPP